MKNKMIYIFKTRCGEQKQYNIIITLLSNNIKANLYLATINCSYKVDRNYYKVIIIKTAVKFDLQQNPIGSEKILEAIIDKVYGVIKLRKEKNTNDTMDSP